MVAGRDSTVEMLDRRSRKALKLLESEFADRSPRSLTIFGMLRVTSGVFSSDPRQAMKDWN